MQPPKPRNRRQPLMLTFRVNEAERTLLNQAAAQRGISRSQLIRLALAQIGALPGGESTAQAA